MTAGHGGHRPGAGRPKGSATRKRQAPDAAAIRYADALTYLEAVVRGDEPPDGQRIAAAKVVLPYQTPKTRAPIASPPPRALRAKTEHAGSVAEVEAWNTRAAEVRRRLASKRTP